MFPFFVLLASFDYCRSSFIIYTNVTKDGACLLLEFNALSLHVLKKKFLNLLKSANIGQDATACSVALWVKPAFTARPLVKSSDHLC